MPQASRYVAEGERLLPPPKDERPFLMIEMTLMLAHTPHPVG